MPSFSSVLEPRTTATYLRLQDEAQAHKARRSAIEIDMDEVDAEVGFKRRRKSSQKRQDESVLEQMADKQTAAGLDRIKTLQQAVQNAFTIGDDALGESESDHHEDAEGGAHAQQRAAFGADPCPCAYTDAIPPVPDAVSDKPPAENVTCSKSSGVCQCSARPL
jgi:hypothetical protein